MMGAGPELKVLRLLVAAWAVGAASVWPGPATAQPAGLDPFEACEQLLLSAAAAESTLCFHNAAQKADRWDEARRRLETLRAAHPDLVWAELSLGHIERPFDQARAEALYRSAATRFAAHGEIEGEVLARTNLRVLVRLQGRAEEAQAELQRVVAAAAASREPRIVARGLILEATDRVERSDDLGRAFRQLKRAEALVFPAGPAGLQRQCLAALANASARLGRLDEALSAYERLGELSREAGDGSAEAQARYSRANLTQHRLERLPMPGDRERTLVLARQALAAAERARHLAVTAMSLRLVAELLPRDPASRREAVGHLRRCLALAGELRQPQRHISCTWTLAERMADEDPAQADRFAREALQAALDLGDAVFIAAAWRAYLTVGFKTRPREEMLAEARRALDAVETLRELQGDARSRAEVFGAWSDGHHRFSGDLLQSRSSDDRTALAEAFAVMERLRARSLAEDLVAGPLSASGPGAALQAERAQVFRRLSAVQRRLLEPRGSTLERETDLAERRALELREQELRAGLRSGLARLGRSPAATLDEIEGTLDPDEALLSFQVGLWEDDHGDFRGGAWVLVSTRGGTQAFRLPGREQLEPAVPVWIGLFARRDGSEADVAASLHARLLAPALASLPASVRRLVVVPDGPLHDVPFAALRASPQGEPLIARHEVTLVPSAGLWRHWRQARSAAPPGGVLVLADPVAPSAARALVTGTGEAGDDAPLGPLPGARREARAAEAQARGPARLLAGLQASEAALRGMDLAPFGIVHFAAHAVADQEEPERTSVVLAPGGPEDDGLLQAREIAELQLAGRLIVLSACRSAGGPALGGEGAASLARAFFQAGATSVVASLWSLRDDETSWLMERFYEHLGRGLTAGAALRAAQADAWQAGLPAAAWSGVVLLGDGAVRPLVGARPGTTGRRLVGITVVLGLAGLVAAAWLRRRRAAA